jgi:hypothetical protein
MKHLCANGHRSMFRNCPVCAAQAQPRKRTRKYTPTPKRLGSWKAAQEKRALKITLGPHGWAKHIAAKMNAKAIANMASQSVTDVIQAMRMRA